MLPNTKFHYNNNNWNAQMEITIYLLCLLYIPLQSFLSVFYKDLMNVIVMIYWKITIEILLFSNTHLNQNLHSLQPTIDKSSLEDLSTHINWCDKQHRYTKFIITHINLPILLMRWHDSFILSVSVFIHFVLSFELSSHVYSTMMKYRYIVASQ